MPALIEVDTFTKEEQEQYGIPSEDEIDAIVMEHQKDIIPLAATQLTESYHISNGYCYCASCYYTQGEPVHVPCESNPDDPTPSEEPTPSIEPPNPGD